MRILHILTIISLSLLSCVWLSMFCKVREWANLTWSWGVEGLISCSFLHSQHSAMSVGVLASVMVVVSFIFISSNWSPESVTSTVSQSPFTRSNTTSEGLQEQWLMSRSSGTVTDVSLVHKSSQSDIPTAAMIAKPCLHWSHPDWCFPGVICTSLKTGNAISYWWTAGLFVQYDDYGDLDQWRHSLCVKKISSYAMVVGAVNTF